MDYSANEIKVGMVVVVGFLILMGFLTAIIGVNWGESSNEYHTYLKNVPGIAIGSIVKFGGFDVGYVTAMELSTSDEGEARVELHMQVADNTPIRATSQAYVTSVGIMSNKHIEITSGQPDSPLLPSGSLLQSKEVLTLMQMAEPFGEMTGDIKNMLGQFSELFNNENREHLSNVIANLDNMIAEGGGKFVNLTSNLDNLTSNLAEVSNSLNELMSTNRGNFDETLEHIEKTTRQTSQLIADLRESLNQFENLVSANGSSVVEIMENFQFASQNLEELTRTVKERPWLLVRKAAPPERKMP